VGIRCSFSENLIVLFIILTLLFTSYFSAYCQLENISVDRFTITVADDSYRSKALELFPERFTIRNLTYVTDGVCKNNDLDALLNLEAGKEVEVSTVLNALFYLTHLGLFKHIAMHVSIVEQGVYDISFDLVQHVLLDYLKISGLLRSKHKLKQLYMIDSGELFDASKHRYSIDQMQSFLREQGYLKARVYDVVLPENNQKAVVVRCGIDMGHRFKIGHVTALVDCVSDVGQVDLSHLTSYVQDFLTRKLHNRYYSDHLLKKTEQKIRGLLQQQGFLEVTFDCVQTLQPKIHSVDLKVTIALEKKREIVVWGNVFFKYQEILEHLLLYGKSTWHFPVSIIVDEIEQLYKTKGFWNVRVTVKDEQQRMFCFVDEGVRSSIASAVLHHAQYSRSQLLVLQAFKHAYKERYIDMQLIKKCTDKLIKLYKAAGFWDIKIIQQDFKPTKKEYAYDYVMFVDEGKQRVWGQHIVETDAHVAQTLNQQWGYCKGLGFDKALLQEQKQWILKHFKGQGYHNVRVDCALQELADATVDVAWNITLPKAAMKFGKTLIVGTTHVPYHQIVKELAYEPGEQFSAASLERTLQNLKQIPVFDSVQVYPSREVDELGCKPIFIKLVEADRYEIKTRFGLQQVGRNLQLRRGFTYKVGCSFIMNRLFKATDQWSVSADVTRFYQDIHTTYEFPWFCNRDIRFQLKAYDSVYQQPVYIGSQDSLYKAVQQGGLWNVSKKLKDQMISGSLGIEFLGLYEADQPDLQRIMCYDKQLLEKKRGYLFCEPMWLWRRVDNILSPHHGHTTTVTARMMFDFNNHTSFAKILAEHAHYLSVTDDIVLALRARAGHVFNRCFTQIHPIERFYLGGPSSIRGYERDFCPPFGLLTCPIEDQHAGLPPCANNIWRYAAQGGRTMLNANIEARCNVYKNIGFVVFSDFGALFQNSIPDSWSKAKDHMFAGSGFGVRYDTPIGPLRFDVGFKWKIQKPDFEAGYSLCLSLGQAF